MIRIGTSSCILGNKVRFDGGHKRSGFVASTVDKHYELIPFCPEVGMGMTVPRPTIHLMQYDLGIALVDSKDHSINHTDKAALYFQYIKHKIKDLDGYILAAKSPTCGMERIKVYDVEGGVLHRKGTGIFAAALRSEFPFLPIEEDGRLNDQGLKESFFTRVVAHNEFRTKVAHQPSLNALVNFHSCYKFLVLAHKPEAYSKMGRLVANGKSYALDDLLYQYQELLMGALKKPSTRKRHCNVMMHIQGFFKKQLSKEEKAELSEKIEQYRLGYLPLLSPLTLLSHYLKRYPNPYLMSQRYFQPFPLELGLMA